MSKLSITEAVKIIPVSESTLRRDLKSGKLSFQTDEKKRKQIDISELTRVYGHLKEQNGTLPQREATSEQAEPVNDTRQNLSKPVNDTRQNPSMTDNDTFQNLSMTDNDTFQNPSMTENDTPTVVAVVALLENQIADLKAQLAQASDRETALITEKSKLLDLTDRLQKQNEILMLPPEPKTKQTWWQRLTGR